MYCILSSIYIMYISIIFYICPCIPPFLKDSSATCLNFQRPRRSARPKRTEVAAAVFRWSKWDKHGAFMRFHDHFLAHKWWIVMVQTACLLLVVAIVHGNHPMQWLVSFHRQNRTCVSMTQSSSQNSCCFKKKSCVSRWFRACCFCWQGLRWHGGFEPAVFAIVAWQRWNAGGNWGCQEHPFESVGSLASSSAEFEKCSHACTNHPQINGNQYQSTIY